MKRNTILILLFTILTALLITYFFFGRKPKKQFSWKETYRADSDQPFGTTFIRQLLESYRPEEKFIYNSQTPLAELLNTDSTSSGTDYIFIGEEILLSEEDNNELLKFIHAGNDAFIATKYLPYDLVDSIFVPECENRLFVNEHAMHSVTFNFYHPSLNSAKGFTYTYKPNGQRRDYKWTALQDQVFCDSTKALIALGYFNKDAVNFFRLPFGEGNLYIHTNPIAFTNYFLRMPEQADYASDVFSHLRGKSIIWDEFSRSQFTSPENESNPLALIMQHESLKYAWWLMLASVILYTVFTAKRKQRIIPVREEKVNTSLEYVKMISALHFENGNNKDIALKKMKYFLYFIRAKYGINTAHLTPHHFKRLSEKSQIDLEHIQSIFDQYGRIEKNPYNSAGSHELMNLYNAIDYFYKRCK